MHTLRYNLLTGFFRLWPEQFYALFLVSSKTMEFVIEGLRDIFYKSRAETKTDQVRMRARKAGVPLRCSLEEA